MALIAAQAPDTPKGQANQADGHQEGRPFEASSQPPPALRGLPREAIADQKFIWLRPFRLKRTDVPWAATLLGATAGLMATDGRVGQELSKRPPGAGYDFSRRVGQSLSPLTDLGLAGTFYLLGRWRGNEEARNTGVLGFEALAGTAVVVEILKAATERPRPTSSGGRFRNHNADGEFFAGGGSFPSGHAAEAWTLAAVVSQRYSHRSWIPATAYSLAGLVTVSRLIERRHFPSDILVGSVIGYLIARHVSHASSQKPAAAPLRP